ncbi:MAG TPA: hypothetical protein ENN05_01210 [Deltaproteobacteria bacterium]|nr:hypothetical protein [Deltaproteobacteria bacterium]
MYALGRYSGVVMVCMMSVLCMQCTAQKTSPSEIIGVWTTQKESLEGISIEFTPEKMIERSFSEAYEGSITKIESSKGHLYNSTLYSVNYIDSDGEKCLLNVLYSSDDVGTLRLKALQDVEWKRE